MNRVENNNS
jgi:hypothetical protein